jgi:hypothetical protein
VARSSVVETQVLLLFLYGLSDSNAEVRAKAVQQVGGFLGESHSVPWNLIGRYYQPMLELALDQCSSEEILSCQSRVRSLEAVQVLFSLVVPLTLEPSCTCITNKGLPFPSFMVNSIIEWLSDAIFSDEKEVLDAATKKLPHSRQY